MKPHAKVSTLVFPQQEGRGWGGEGVQQGVFRACASFWRKLSRNVVEGGVLSRVLFGRRVFATQADRMMIYLICLQQIA